MPDALDVSPERTPLSIITPAHSKMTSPVNKAMIESYALMVMVMGTFFVYFCGMVWAFCNPKLSGAEEECVAGNRAAPRGDERSEGEFRCVCAHVAPAPRSTGFTQSTYVNFWDDTDSLLSDCNALGRGDHGMSNHIGYGPSCTAHTERLMI
ncbi:Hypothetical protein SMAX5B_017625 [Scophthalmus maximus]|nr:Hypothetical protein SMAX5B_017625 [Scophthalmus maximus]